MGVASVAKDFFGYDGEVQVSDASVALADFHRKNKQGKVFDVVIVDIQNHPLAQSDWTHLRKLMKPGGLVELNWSEPYTLQRELDNFKAFFPDVRIKRGCEHTKNTILVGHAGAKARSSSRQRQQQLLSRA